MKTLGLYLCTFEHVFLLHTFWELEFLGWRVCMLWGLSCLPKCALIQWISMSVCFLYPSPTLSIIHICHRSNIWGKLAFLQLLRGFPSCHTWKRLRLCENQKNVPSYRLCHHSNQDESLKYVSSCYFFALHFTPIKSPHNGLKFLHVCPSSSLLQACRRPAVPWQSATLLSPWGTSLQLSL